MNYDDDCCQFCGEPIDDHEQQQIYHDTSELAAIMYRCNYTNGWLSYHDISGSERLR